jgi:hypothetical protein
MDATHNSRLDAAAYSSTLLVQGSLCNLLSKVIHNTTRHTSKHISTMVMLTHLGIWFVVRLSTVTLRSHPEGLTSAGHTNLLPVSPYPHLIVASITSATTHSPHRHGHIQLQLASRHSLCFSSACPLSTCPLSTALVSLPVPTDPNANTWLQKNICSIVSAGFHSQGQSLSDRSSLLRVGCVAGACMLPEAASQANGHQNPE